MVEQVLTQNSRTAEFILSEADGHLSREVAIVPAGTGILEAGTVLQFSGVNLVAYGGVEDTAGALIGEAAGILYARVDATDEDVKAVYIARLAEVKLAFLHFPPNTSQGTEEGEMIASLALLNIRCR